MLQDIIKSFETKYIIQKKEHDKLISKINEEILENNKKLIDDEELADAYKALKEVISVMDYDAVEMIVGQLDGYKLNKEDEENIEKLKGFMKVFDWDKMEELALAWEPSVASQS